MTQPAARWLLKRGVSDGWWRVYDVFTGQDVIVTRDYKEACRVSDCLQINGAAPRIPYRDDWDTNTTKLLKIRAQFYLLEQELRARLAEANGFLQDRVGFEDAEEYKEGVGAARTYASILDWVHTAMVELGLEYEN